MKKNQIGPFWSCLQMRCAWDRKILSFVNELFSAQRPKLWKMLYNFLHEKLYS